MFACQLSVSQKAEVNRYEVNDDKVKGHVVTKTVTVARLLVKCAAVVSACRMTAWVSSLNTHVLSTLPPWHQYLIPSVLLSLPPRSAVQSS